MSRRAQTARRTARPPAVPSGAGTVAHVVREARAEVFHLAASCSIRIGYVICGPGQPLCGVPVALQPCLDELFAPSVTCHLCEAIARRDGILIAGSEAA